MISVKYFSCFICVLIAVGSQIVQCRDLTCCDHAKGSCLMPCKQLSLETLGTEKDELVKERSLRPIHQYCPVHLKRFWGCINNTITAFRKGEDWIGRSCCSMAQTRNCQLSCLTAQRSVDLLHGCRRSDESAVFQCVEQKEEGELCCRQSRDKECLQSCTLFLGHGFQQSQYYELKKDYDSKCEKQADVTTCIANLTGASNLHNSEKNLPCCSSGKNSECQEACLRALTSRHSEDEIMKILIEEGCGHPRPDDRMWQCFLQNAEPQGVEIPSKIDRLGMDAAKLHCCSRASSVTCRRLCHNTYSREWTGSWSDLDRICLSSSNESKLRTCVEEVEEPCELGCEGLSFCSNFNNRPNELFRRCSRAADIAAQEQFEQWRRLRYIPVSEKLNLPLKNIEVCAPEKWRAVTCILNVKPCQTTTHASQICRSDCVSLLHECVDFSKIEQAELQDVVSICKLLSPSPGEPCVSISPFANYVPSRALYNQVAAITNYISPEITQPCKFHHCNSSEECVVNRNCIGRKCPVTSCRPSCLLGEVSKMKVPTGSWIRVPTGKTESERLCQCQKNGEIDQCKILKSSGMSPCWLNRNHIQHGRNFWLDCNRCACRSGELMCSRDRCAKEDDVAYPTSGMQRRVMLPCNCPPIRKSVCGSNGKTYQSPCLAKCSGLTDEDISMGACSDRNPCDGVTCGNRQHCVPIPRICLLPSINKCPQYQCVPMQCEESRSHDLNLVCDTMGREHSSLCSLASRKASFAHQGNCLRPRQCSLEGPICGIDGEVYSSECAAMAVGIPKDYSGTCKLPSSQDGMHLRVLYSPSEVYKISEATGNDIISVRDVSDRLNSLVHTAECQVGAYLGLGAELVVVVRPSFKKWTSRQLQVCISEAERLSTLINKRSPMMQIDAVLSVLTTSTTRYAETSGSLASCSLNPLSALSLLGLVTIILIR